MDTYNSCSLKKPVILSQKKQKNNQNNSLFHHAQHVFFHDFLCFFWKNPLTVVKRCSEPFPFKNCISKFHLALLWSGLGAPWTQVWQHLTLKSYKYLMCQCLTKKSPEDGTVSKMILFEPIWIFKAATGPAEQDQQKEPVGADLEEPGWTSESVFKVGWDVETPSVESTFSDIFCGLDEYRCRRRMRRTWLRTVAADRKSSPASDKACSEREIGVLLMVMID